VSTESEYESYDSVRMHEPLEKKPKELLLHCN